MTLPTAAPAADAALLISQEGAVRTLSFNRPAALNAFTAQLLAQTRAALDEAAALEERLVGYKPIKKQGLLGRLFADKHELRLRRDVHRGHHIGLAGDVQHRRGEPGAVVGRRLHRVLQALRIDVDRHHGGALVQ